MRNLPTAPRPVKLAVRGVVIVSCLIIASMWVYYFFFASDQGVYQMQDGTWRLKAAPICRAANAERAKLSDTSGGFITHPTLAQMQQRADLADKATDIVAKMVTDIVAIPVPGDRDRLLLQAFDQQYQILIKDRRRYAASLRAGHLVPYSETVVAGGPVTNVVEDFTAGVKGNDIPDCSPPNDLGGTIQP